MINLRSLPLCVFAGAFLCSAAALAQQAAPAARIVTPIDQSQLVTLKGNVNPLANANNDRGPVSPSLPMTGLILVLSRSPEQQAAFDAYVAGEYDQTSPNYHQWLTPQQIGAQYGPAQADINALSAWLAGHGFAVTNVAADHMTIRFSGAAGQVESAFHTEIHNLSVAGKMHIANMTDPQIPAALAPVVVGIKGLHNFFPHPLHRMGSKVYFNPEAHGWVRQQPSSGPGLAAGAFRTQPPAASANSPSSPKPNFYYPIPNSNGSVEEDVAPYDFAKIYNLPSTWPTSINGSGQIITIIGTSDIDSTDVSTFKSAFGLPAGTAPVTVHGPDGDPGNCGSNPSSDICNDGDLEENSLDVEWSGAVAPQAQIVLVTDAYNNQTDPTNDPIYDGAQWAVDNASVSGSAVYGSHILSVSYGLCELFNGTASNVAYRDLWETAYAAGIAVFVSTGDAGSAVCDFGGDEQEGNPYEAQYGLTVSAAASSPYNTAVGGTDFSWCHPNDVLSGKTVLFEGCSSSNASPYWNSSNSSQQASANGYVPETPWNDTCENPIIANFLETLLSTSGFDTFYDVDPATPEESCNTLYENMSDGSPGWFDFYEGTGEVLAGYVDTIGGSGGASNCVVNTSTSTTSGSCNSTDTSTGSSYGNLTLVNDGWPKPPWQSGITGIPTDGVRDLPDVSFFAGDGALDSATLVCVSSDGASCTDLGNTGTTSAGGAEEIGGTSVGTPEMAGVMALINQSAGAPQGNPNAELYDLAGRQTYSECSAETVTNSSSCYFHSLDQGTNAMPCAPSDSVLEGGAVYEGDGVWDVGTTQFNALPSPNCTILNPGDQIGTLSGYSPSAGAASGYNQATGLGSLNVANVLSAWPSGAPSPTFSLSATSLTMTPGATTGNTSTITVEPVDGFGDSAAETVSFTCAVTTTPSGAPSPVTCGTIASATVSGSAEATTTMTVGSTSTTTTGTYVLTITGTSGSITQQATFNVTVSPTYNVSATSPSSGISPGGSATSTITVTGLGGYAGAVTISCSLTSGPANQAGDAPSCSITTGSPVTLSASTTSGQATATITTVPPTTSDLVRPDFGKGKGWPGSRFAAGSGALLALLIFFGIPARRRSWRSMLTILVAMVGLGVLASCGGGSSTCTSSSCTTNQNQGTTMGTYIFTVTATGNPAVTPTPTSQFTLTVD